VKRTFEKHLGASADDQTLVRVTGLFLYVAVSRLQVIPPGSEPTNAETLADQIESFRGALTARQLSEVLSIFAVTILKLAERGTLQPFRVGSCERFRPRSVADWLRTRAG
jgi:hypothetical protein